jgi:hypothetical protein
MRIIYIDAELKKHLLRLHTPQSHSTKEEKKTLKMEMIFWNSHWIIKKK